MIYMRTCFSAFGILHFVWFKGLMRKSFIVEKHNQGALCLAFSSALSIADGLYQHKTSINSIIRAFAVFDSCIRTRLSEVVDLMMDLRGKEII